MIGTEHEYSINDENFKALPISDQIIRTICGRYDNEILFGTTKLGKELQKTVLEFVPRTPASDLSSLESQVIGGIEKFNHIFSNKYTLLGLGMHPFACPGDIPVWDHDEGEYYEAYNRLFNIRQHGWLNIQALQVNLPYRNDRELVLLYNRVRSLLPYLIAVTASSPMVEGKFTGSCDNRLLFYRKNQEEIPLICNRIIPEKIRAVADYNRIQQEVYSELRARRADILCEEWLNSSGIIVRFSRRCLEIKALDEQESVHSDMAVCAFIRSLLRSGYIRPETDRDALLDLTETAIRNGTAGLRADLEKLYDHAIRSATEDEKKYLPVIADRIRNGSLAERMVACGSNEGSVIPFLREAASCLRENRSFGT